MLIPQGIKAEASALDAGIQKNFLGSGTTTLITSNRNKSHYENS